MAPAAPKRDRPMTGTSRVKKHVTFDAEVLHRLQQEAQHADVGFSEVVQGHIKADWQHAEGQASILEARLDQLSSDLSDLRAKVLPLVATVTALLRQMEGELPAPLSEAQSPAVQPKIATYEEMYGPIAQTRPPDPPTPVVVPKPRRWWP